MGFFLVINLIVTARWFTSIGLPRSPAIARSIWSISTRAPVSRWQRDGGDGDGDAPATRTGAPGSAPGSANGGARLLTPEWTTVGVPNVFWSAAGTAVAQRLPDVRRSIDGVVVGWGVDAGDALARAIDLTFIAGQDPGQLPPTRRAGTVIVTRCLAQALFGDAPGVGVGTAAVLQSPPPGGHHGRH